MILLLKDERAKLAFSALLGLVCFCIGGAFGIKQDLPGSQIDLVSLYPGQYLAKNLFADLGSAVLICLLGGFILGFLFVYPILAARSYFMGVALGYLIASDSVSGSVVVAFAFSALVRIISLSVLCRYGSELSFDIINGCRNVGADRLRSFSVQCAAGVLVSFFAALYNAYLMPWLCNKTVEMFLDKSAFF